MRTGLWSILVVLLFARATDGGPLTLTNGSFETGDFTGWETRIATGLSEFSPVPRPAGSIDIASGFFFDGGSRLPIEGANMAVVGSAVAGGFTGFGDQGLFDIELRQTIQLGAGMSVSGRSFFYNGDYAPQDNAWVRVFDSHGLLVATLWQAWSGTRTGAGGPAITTDYLQASPWQDWGWLAPSDGMYTLALGVTTRGDDRLASYGAHDAIRVPEPSSVALLITGLGIFGARRRFR